MKGDFQDGNTCLLLFVNKIAGTLWCLDFKYYKGRIHPLDKNEFSRIGVVALIALIQLFLLVFACEEHFIFKICEGLPLVCYPLTFYLNFMWQEKRKIKFLIAFIRHLEVCQKISQKVYPLSCHFLLTIFLKMCTLILYLKLSVVLEGCDVWLNVLHQIMVNVLVLPGFVKLGGVCLALFYFEVQHSGLNESFENILFQMNSNKFDYLPKQSWIHHVDAKVMELLRVTRRLRRTLKLIVRFDELNEGYLGLSLVQAYVFLFDLYFRFRYFEQHSPPAFYVCFMSNFLSYIDFGVMAYNWRRLEVAFKKTQALAVAVKVKHWSKLDIQMDMLLNYALIIQPRMAKFAQLFYFYLITWTSVILAIHLF